MDVAYKQHASQARRKNRSSTNLNHLSLAPLTTKLPLPDPEDLPDFEPIPARHNVSYLQGKSAPTTPQLLSLSPVKAGSRSRRGSMHSSHRSTLPKSKSASHLTVDTAGAHGGLSPVSPTLRRRRHDQWPYAREHNDSDWMLRAGALMSAEARESKGQAWLLSRASSTSLTGLHDAEDEALEREVAREKEVASRHHSRRGSFAPMDDMITSPNSRFGSRSHSRAGSRPARTPRERLGDDGYFDQVVVSEEYMKGPDFVSLDEKLEAVEIDTTFADEATVRRLVSGETVRKSSWFGNLMGWSLFSVEENDEESDTADADVSDDEAKEGQLSRSASTRHFEDLATDPEPGLPPPKADEGGWQDAAWLLSVASKVLL